MRVNAGLLSQALDQVQAAIFEPSLWLPTIEAISRASGALGANIMEPSGRGTFGAALSTENLDSLLDGYVRDDWGSRDFRANLLAAAPPFRRGAWKPISSRKSSSSTTNTINSCENTALAIAF
jgi:hypothetical protein